MFRISTKYKCIEDINIYTQTHICIYIYNVLFKYIKEDLIKWRRIAYPGIFRDVVTLKTKYRLIRIQIKS